MVRFKKVLVVDDERALCDLMSSILAMEGFEVAVAYDGSAAQKVAADFKPDLIITDIRMPLCDGFCLLEAVNASIVPPIPMIVMSGFAGGSDELSKLNNYPNVLKYFDKPIDVDDVIKFIRDVPVAV